MEKHKRLLLLGLVVLGLLASSLACGGSTQEVVDGANAVQDEADNISEKCQLNALGRYIGDENKVKFLANIHDGCVEAGMEADWLTKWTKYSDISLSEYEAAQ